MFLRIVFLGYQTKLPCICIAMIIWTGALRAITYKCCNLSGKPVIGNTTSACVCYVPVPPRRQVVHHQTHVVHDSPPPLAEDIVDVNRLGLLTAKTLRTALAQEDRRPPTSDPARCRSALNLDAPLM